jgi:hypothetical protein
MTFSSVPFLHAVVSLADLRETLAKLETETARVPSVIYVREDAWPAIESQLLNARLRPVTGPFHAEPFGPSFNGIPIRVVPFLPRPWMTDLEMSEGLRRELERCP